jgi:phosphohistidine swiveling domain-containing protein
MPLFLAITHQKYREYARILMVKNLGELRSQLIGAVGTGFLDPRNSYFHTVREILNGSFDEALCRSRREEYDKFADFHLPPKLSNRFVPEKVGKSSGLSPGKAEGYLVTESTFRTDDPRPQILYSESLSPNLTKYFPSVLGIVSSHGGFLSHLSIIARERGLPVVVSALPVVSHVGKFVAIDGSTGNITFPQP